MKKITHCIDWFQYSLAWPAGVEVWPIDSTEELSIFKSSVPMVDVSGLPPRRPTNDKIMGMQGYTKTYDMLYATAHVNPNHRAQKIGVRMTGKDLTAYRDLGGTDAKLVKFAHHTNASISRLDIAFDLFNYQVDLQKVYKDWKADKVKTRAKTVHPLTSAVKTASGEVTEATTLYIGSRESELMVRFYEKGKEQGTDLDWLRVELEIKGDKADAIIRDCDRVGVEVVAKELLRQAIPVMPYKFWTELTKGDSTPLEAVGRKKTARQVWLEDVILPLLSDELCQEWESNEPTGLTQAIEALLRQNWQRRAIELRRQYQV